MATPLRWIGLGFQSGIPSEVLWQGIQRVFEDHHWDWTEVVAAIAGIATLEHKTQDPALIGLCQQQRWQLQGFQASQLKAVVVPHSSHAVAAAVGTPSVAEAACLLACHQGHLIVPRQVLPSPFGAITVAVAQSASEPDSSSLSPPSVGMVAGDASECV